MTASLRYLGGLRTEATHTRSGSVLITDAPVDNHGQGQAFSPTDLVAVSLLSCILTVMAIRARKEGLGELIMDGSVQKNMANKPRRVAKLEVQIAIHNTDIDPAMQAILRKTGDECPVALSLHPQIEQVIQYTFA